ncbi:MFS transporter [Streptomyces sp. NBC_01477]|uniref:MFS transporter n=1 Tax=Streptomyces sp. NBC_01477 TaxID=2976015 RepID=UPI002E2F7EBD|nr:MFS transporter [Streptomyces sp. NBC_01477]
MVDSLGTGLFLPYALLYFLDTTRVPLSTIGLALSAAAALALPCSAVFGQLVDRVGARRSVVLANLAQAAGFLGYLQAGSATRIVAFGFLVTAGQNLFWTANGVLITQVSDAADRVRWFSLLRVVRNLGTGVGALLASAAAMGSAHACGRAVVAANAASFLVAAAVLARWRPREPPAAAAPAPARGPGRGGYREVLADRRFTALNAATVLFAHCLLALPLLLAVYVTRSLGRPAWVAGALLAGNTALIVALQTPLTEAMRPYRDTRLLRLAALFLAASSALLWAAPAGSTGWTTLSLVAALACYTAGEIICCPVLTDLVATLAPPELRGRYFALNQVCWSLAAVLAPSVLTRLLTAGTAGLWITLLITAGAASVLAAGIDAGSGELAEPPPAGAAPDPSRR